MYESLVMSGPADGNYRYAAAGVTPRGHVHSAQLWSSCWRGLHPAWLLTLRFASFVILLGFLSWDILDYGPSIYVYYTEWTFTLVVVYFAVGTIVSAHGCMIYHSKIPPSDHEERDVEESLSTNFVTFRGKQIRGNIKLQSHYDQEAVQQRAGFWGYLMQVAYQFLTCYQISHWFAIISAGPSSQDSILESFTFSRLSLKQTNWREGLRHYGYFPEYSRGIKGQFLLMPYPYAFRGKHVVSWVFCDSVVINGDSDPYFHVQTCGGAVILTDLVFWCVIVPFLTDAHLQLNLLMGSMHTLNAVFLLLDASINSLPFPWFRLAYFVLWSCFYVIFQWVIHACGYSMWPYPFLELSSTWAPLWYFCLAVVHIPCYGLFSLLVRAKNAIFSRLFPQAFVETY